MENRKLALGSTLLFIDVIKPHTSVKASQFAVQQVKPTIPFPDVRQVGKQMLARRNGREAHMLWGAQD